MIASVFTGLGSVVTAFTTVIVSLFEGLIDIFYDSTATALTDVGNLVLCAFGISLVFFAFRFIFRLIHLRG